MAGTILLAVLACVALYALKIYRQFAANLAAAKASGITYTIVPFFLVNRLYQIVSIVLVPILRALPNSWTDIWLDLTLEWGHTRRYEPFKRLGADTFLTVSPERIVLNTAEASVINQITTRRNDFPKALEVYESLKIYGDNVVALEGQSWRHHRKITSPPFTEKNNHLVWAESINQAQAMISGWFGGNTERTKTITTVADDAMRLSLHIISRAGFGVRLEWPGSEGDKAEKKRNNGGNTTEKSSGLEEGHKMSYTDALGSLLHNMLWVLVTPPFLLKNLPFKTTKHAYTSYVEWGKYMQDMFTKKKELVLAGEEGENLDLMIAMLKGAGITAKSEIKDGQQAPTQTMTDSEILGNAFVFILAGHETTANSIHFCLILLAMNLPSQRHLQRDLDSIFGSRPPSEWSYEHDSPKLFSSMAGAVLSEELRLYPPVTGIPKSTAPNSPQPLTVAGKKCTVPANTYISLMGPSAHRNPNQWPTAPPRDPLKPSHPLSNLDNDLEEFKPERWLLDPSSNAAPFPTSSTTEHPNLTPDLGIDSAPDTPPTLYSPPKGAYIPFSEGYRSCLGRRFAQVELLALLAVIFTQYSVELAVDEYATDAEVNSMPAPDRRALWERQRDRVQRQLNEDMGSVITLQLRKGFVGLRFVKRGGERFDFG